MTVDTLPRPTVRGSHAERTASMRHRLIDAAIEVLQEVGYAATTTQLVTSRAEVSRGAMLHHFPTKIDLIIATAEYAAEAQNRFVRRALARVPSGMEMYLAITDATWAAVCEPSGLALIEIIMASRSDPALGERLPAVVNRFEREQFEQVCQMAGSLGIVDHEAIDRMVRLHRAAFRGLAIEMMYSGDRGPADSAAMLLGWYKRSLTGALITGQTVAVAGPKG